MKNCYIYSLLLLFSIGHLFALGDDPKDIYINKYKHIAISEMNRTGIPASIKLAQGLLESGAGKSTLAREANNHFGIKCSGSWTGKTFFREDDDRNAKGDLIKSCFRSFDSASQSFFAHSNFLTDQKRYAFLFDIHRSDYRAWAKGLRKAGYATDKAYANKLIDLIEKHQLYLFDSESISEPIVAATTAEMPAAVMLEEPSKRTTTKRASSSRSKRTKNKSRSNRSTRSKQKKKRPSSRSKEGQLASKRIKTKK